MTWLSPIRQAFIIALVVTAVVASARAQDRPPATPWPAEAEPMCTNADVAQWRDAMLPHVEAVMGRQFTAPPPIRVVTRAELDAALQTSVAALDEPGRLPDERTEMLRELERLVSVPALLALTTHDGTILVAAGNVGPLLTLGDVPGDRAADVVRLTIAHELAHAMHAQQRDLVRDLRRPRTAAEAKAHAALREGIGTWVQRAVAERCGLLDAEADLRRVMALGDDPETSRGRFESIYLAGEAFVRHHVEAHGAAFIWTLLESPPQTYAEITAPESWGGSVEVELAPEQLLDGIPTAFGIEGWTRTVLPAEVADIAPMIRQLAPTSADAFLGAVTRVTNAIYVAPGRERMLNVILYESTDGRALMPTLAALAEAHFAQARQMAAHGSITLEETTADPIAGVRAAQSWHLTGNLRAGEGAEARIVQTIGIAAARRGDVAVQIAMMSHAPDAEGLQHGINLLLDRAARGAAVRPVEPPERADDMVALAARVAGQLPEPASWTTKRQDPRPAALRQLTGGDEAAQIACDVALESARGIVFERREPAHEVLTAAIITLTSPQAATTVHTAMAAALPDVLTRISGMPGATVEADPPQVTELSGGDPATWIRATVSLPQQPASDLWFGVVRANARVVHVMLSTTTDPISAASFMALVRDALAATAEADDADA